MHTLPDIVGANAVVGLGNTPGANARWVQFIVTGAGSVRIGDVATTSARGLPVDAGGGQMLPPIGGLMSYYALDQLRVYVPVGAVVSVAYAN